MHNLLIIGGEQSDRIHYAVQQTKLLLCLGKIKKEACQTCVNCQRITANSHPNVVLVSPLITEGKPANDSSGVIKIDQIRYIVLENQKTNFENGISVFIITHMHKTTKSAANALLKVIEENKPTKLIMALAPSRMTVLPTIASRLITHTVKPTISHAKIDEHIRTKIACLSSTPPVGRFSLCSQFSAEREELIAELDELRDTCHLLLREKAIAPLCALKISDALNKAHENLRKNLNPRLVVEQLVFKEWPFHQL